MPIDASKPRAADPVVQFEEILRGDDGERYVASVYRARQRGGLWEARLVFVPVGGGRALATDRETTQSSPRQIEYWASGLTVGYLQGALRRARRHTLPETFVAE